MHQVPSRAAREIVAVIANMSITITPEPLYVAYRAFSEALAAGQFTKDVEALRAWAKSAQFTHNDSEKK